MKHKKRWYPLSNQIISFLGVTKHWWLVKRYFKSLFLQKLLYNDELSKIYIHSMSTKTRHHISTVILRYQMEMYENKESRFSLIKWYLVLDTHLLLSTTGIMCESKIYQRYFWLKKNIGRGKQNDLKRKIKQKFDLLFCSL